MELLFLPVTNRICWIPFETNSFHHVLHDRLPRNGKHFLGLRLGGRQQAGAVARDGYHCALDHCLLNIAT